MKSLSNSNRNTNCFTSLTSLSCLAFWFEYKQIPPPLLPRKNVPEWSDHFTFRFSPEKKSVNATHFLGFPDCFRHLCQTTSHFQTPFEMSWDAWGEPDVLWAVKRLPSVRVTQCEEDCSRRHWDTAYIQHKRSRISPQSSQLAEPRWINPGSKSGISVHELISTRIKKKKARRGMNGRTVSQKLSQARKKPPPPWILCSY